MRAAPPRRAVPRSPLAPILPPLLAALALAGCGGSSDPPGDAAGDARADAADGGGGVAPGESPFEGVAVDEVEEVAGLDGRVGIVRDERGIPHVYASSLRDAAYGQGWAHAVDRFPQMEFFRRSARGRVAELLGEFRPATVVDDLENRLLGFERVAEKQLDELGEDSDASRLLRGYAAGVTAYVEALRAGERTLPPPYDGFLPVATLEDWTPVDTLAIGRLQAHSLSFDADDEVRFTALTQAIRETFPEDADDEAIALRAGFFEDVLRFAPPNATVQHPGFEPEPATAAPGAFELPAPRSSGAARPDVSADALAHAAEADPGLHDVLGGPTDRPLSNSWVVGPERTEGGRAFLCNDPHLGLTNPPLFHLSHLRVRPDGDGEAVDAFGANFPGVPGILTGHNDRVAWGLTTSPADRSDAYVEEFTPASGDEPATVLHEGEEKPVERIEESVKVGNFGEDVETIAFDVLRTPTGRILVPELTESGPEPLEAGEQTSWAWTGLRATPDFRTVAQALTADDVDELGEAFESFHATNQTIVAADVEGNILSFAPGGVPIREEGARTWHPDDNPEGTAPWWVLPGQGSADWDGRLAPADGPRTTNPASGQLVTANNQVLGSLSDDNPLDDALYFGYDAALGFRAKRITGLLDGSAPGSPAAGGAKLTREALHRIQGDTRSNLARRLREPLLEDLAAMEEELDEPGTHPELSGLAEEHADREEAFRDALQRLRDWEGHTPAGVAERGAQPAEAERRDAVATTLWNVWLVELNEALLADELDAIGWSLGTDDRVTALIHLVEASDEELATLDPDTGESILWDDMTTDGTRETRTHVVAEAFLRALATTRELFPEGTAMADRVWGELHRLVLEALLPVPGGALDLPGPEHPQAGEGYARPGDQYAVNVCDPGLGDTDFGCGSGPVVRFCVGLGEDGAEPTMMLPGGQSIARASPHYDDWVPGWLDLEPTDVALDDEAVAGAAERHRLLRPADE